MRSAQSFRASFPFPIGRNRSWPTGVAVLATGRGWVKHGKHSGGNRSDRLQRFCIPRECVRRNRGAAFREQAIQISGIEFSLLKIGIAEDALEQRNVGLDATHEIFAERSLEPQDRLLPV